MKPDYGMLTDHGILRRVPSREMASAHGNEPVATGHGGVNRCLRFMARNFDRPIQLKDVAAAAGLSRRGLIKAFAKHLGENPGAVLRRIRLDCAKRLLTEQDLKLKEIARLCGYRSENTFCVAFQRTTGLAPKKFQRQSWLAAYRSAAERHR